MWELFVPVAVLQLRWPPFAVRPVTTLAATGGHTSCYLCHTGCYRWPHRPPPVATHPRCVYCSNTTIGAARAMTRCVYSPHKIWRSGALPRCVYSPQKIWRSGALPRAPGETRGAQTQGLEKCQTRFYIFFLGPDFFFKSKNKKYTALKKNIKVRKKNYKKCMAPQI